MKFEIGKAEIGKWKIEIRQCQFQFLSLIDKTMRIIKNRILKKETGNLELENRNSLFQLSIFNFQISIFMLLTLLLFACSTKNHEHAENSNTTAYTCPMHPDIVENEPGPCPICGMDLVKTTGHGEEIAISDELAFLLQPSNATVVSSISTVKPIKEDVRVTTTANGIITYDTRNAYTIPVRFGGRIEKLFVKYNFQPVRKGQKLLEIYSPELLTAQRELLFLLESDPDNSALIEAAKQKLRLLGVSDSQIRQLAESGTEQNSFAVYSPYDGYVVESQTTAPQTAVPTSNPASANAGGMGGMGGGGNVAISPSAAQPASQELDVREGMYVNAGQTLFKVINTSTLRAEFDLYAADAPKIKVGEPVSITWGNQELETKVDFIQPFFNQGENFMKVRVYLSGGENSLKVGQLVKAHFESTVENALWIPALAVLDLGTKQVVFVKRNGVFKPQEVTTGRRSEGMIELVEGLSPDEDIAYNAQFMVDGAVKIENGN